MLEPGTSSILFARIVPTPDVGPYILTLTRQDHSPFLESRLDVQAPGKMLWHTFAINRSENQVVNGRTMQKPAMVVESMSALPVLESNEPQITLMPDGSQSFGHGGRMLRTVAPPESARGLPGMVPLSDAWHVEWFEGMNLRQREMTNNLAAAARGTWRLKLSENQLVIGDDEGFGGDASKLLARWWVNGRPIDAAPEAEQQMVERPARQHTVGPIPLVLPASLGDLKAGDRVSLQLMYCPEGYALTGITELWSPIQLEKVMRQSPVEYPQLTDRFTFEVTEQMLADRDAMTKQGAEVFE